MKKIFFGVGETNTGIITTLNTAQQLKCYKIHNSGGDTLMGHQHCIEEKKYTLLSLFLFLLVNAKRCSTQYFNIMERKQA